MKKKTLVNPTITFFTQKEWTILKDTAEGKITLKEAGECSGTSYQNVRASYWAFTKVLVRAGILKIPSSPPTLK